MLTKAMRGPYRKEQAVKKLGIMARLKGVAPVRPYRFLLRRSFVRLAALGYSITRGGDDFGIFVFEVFLLILWIEVFLDYLR